MRAFLGKSFAFTALVLFFLIFSTSIASANMEHKPVKEIIHNSAAGCPMMKGMMMQGMMSKSSCPMMKMMSAKTASCPMMKMMGTMNGERHNMKMNKKM